MDVLLLEDLGQQKLPARRLATVLAEAGWHVQLVPFPGEDAMANLVANIVAVRPRLVVFSVLFAGLVREYLALAATLKAAGSSGHIAMVGALPTLAYTDLLAACPALDSILRGEAEGAIAALARHADDPNRWADVPGLAYRHDGRICVNPFYPPATRRSHWPWPAWPEGVARGMGYGQCRSNKMGPAIEITPAGALRRRQSAYAGWSLRPRRPLSRDLQSPGLFERHWGYGFVTIESSRGCYHRCAFCLPRAAKQAMGERPYLVRPVADLVEEIEAHYEAGARLFLFDDEQFLPPPSQRWRRVEALERELAQRHLRIAFTIKCRPDDVEPELFARLRDLGLVRAYVGVEAGCEEALALLGKGLSTGQSVPALQTLADLGIVADFRCLLFHPWSTLETVRRELAFWETVAAHALAGLRFHEVEVYPGTPLAERLVAEGRMQGDPWLISYTPNDPRAETLRRLCRRMFGTGSEMEHALGTLSRAWFDLCVQERLSAVENKAQRAHLQTVAGALNREVLIVWREALAWAEAARDGTLEDMDAQTNIWTTRLRRTVAKITGVLLPTVIEMQGRALESSPGPGKR